jgi:hypothetical protein
MRVHAREAENKPAVDPERGLCDAAPTSGLATCLMTSRPGAEESHGPCLRGKRP